MTSQVSVCVMTRNEEPFLEDCIRSTLPFCHELIVVDTGSEDATLSIARRYTDKVFHSTLDNDFSAPRNVALSHVRTPWVLYLDADERLAASSGPELATVLEHAADDVEALTVRRYNFLASGGFVSDRVVRISRNRPHIRYRNKVAESVVQSVLDAGGRVADSPLTINHFGHWRAQEVRARKSSWYVRLLRDRVDADPESADLHCRLAMTLKKVGRLEEADAESRHAIKLDPDTPDVVTARAHIVRALGRAEEALTLYRRAAEARPDEPARWNMVGVMALSTGRLEEAEAAFDRAWALDEGLTHVLINQGLVAQARGDYAVAVDRFEAAALRNPGFLEECWSGRLEPDPFQHLDNDSIMRFAGLPYHLAYCRWKLSGEAERLRSLATSEVHARA